MAATLAKAGETDTALDTIAEAVDAADRSGERFYLAELHRQHGELLLATGQDRAAAARCFDTAAEIAKQQGAHGLERRALRSGELNRE